MIYITDADMAVLQSEGRVHTTTVTTCSLCGEVLPDGSSPDLHLKVFCLKSPTKNLAQDVAEMKQNLMNFGERLSEIAQTTDK